MDEPSAAGPPSVTGWVNGYATAFSRRPFFSLRCAAPWPNYGTRVHFFIRIFAAKNASTAVDPRAVRALQQVDGFVYASFQSLCGFRIFKGALRTRIII
jgi:hypothetical protein